MTFLSSLVTCRTLDDQQISTDFCLFISAFTIRVIMECDLVQDFFNLNNIDLEETKAKKIADAPELYEYNTDEELGTSKISF